MTPDASPHDPGIAALVGELSVRSDEFAPGGPPTTSAATTPGQELPSPAVGLLELPFHGMELEDSPVHTLTVTRGPGTPTADALRLLATWAVSEQITERARASTP